MRAPVKVGLARDLALHADLGKLLAPGNARLAVVKVVGHLGEVRAEARDNAHAGDDDTWELHRDAVGAGRDGRAGAGGGRADREGVGHAQRAEGDAGFVQHWWSGRVWAQ